MSTQERITQEAELMPEKLGWSNDGTSEGADIKKSYIAGALSERNKVIEEIREEIDNVLFKRKMHNDTWANGYYTALHDVLGAMK